MYSILWNFYHIFNFVLNFVFNSVFYFALDKSNLDKALKNWF